MSKPEQLIQNLIEMIQRGSDNDIIEIKKEQNKIEGTVYKMNSSQYSPIHHN